MRSLPLFHRVAGQRVVVLGDGDAAAAKRRLVERAGGIPVGEPEAHHARLAFIALEGARDAMRARWPDAGARRNALDRALGEGGRLDPLREHGGGAVTQWLDQPDRPEPTGLIELAIVSADPDDLTLRQARLLGMADVIYHDDTISPAILDRARADSARRPLAQATAAQDRLSIVLKSA